MRLDVIEREAAILKAAMETAEEVGYQWVTRDAIALRANCSAGLVNRYFGTMVELKRKVMREAVRVGNLKLIAEGLADRNPHAMKASPELKARALAALK